MSPVSHQQLAFDLATQKILEAKERQNRIAAIGKRLESVNPAPWIAVRGKDYQGENWLICDAGVFDRGDESDTALVTTDGVHASRLCADSIDDAEFIAHARMDVPWLLLALTAAEARADGAELQRVTLQNEYDAYAQRLGNQHAELKAKLARLEAVKEAAKTVDEWHHKDIHMGNGVQYVRVIDALHEALREAGEVSP